MVLSLTDLLTHSLSIARWTGIDKTIDTGDQGDAKPWYGDIKVDGKKATVTVLGKMARDGVKVDVSQFGTKYNLVIEPKEETDLEAILALTDMVKEQAIGTFPDATWTAKTNGFVYQGLLYLRVYPKKKEPALFDIKTINCKLDPLDPEANSLSLPKDKNVAIVVDIGYWVNVEKKMLGLVLKPQSVRAMGSSDSTAPKVKKAKMVAE